MKKYCLAQPGSSLMTLGPMSYIHYPVRSWDCKIPITSFHDYRDHLIISLLHYFDKFLPLSILSSTCFVILLSLFSCIHLPPPTSKDTLLGGNPFLGNPPFLFYPLLNEGDLNSMKTITIFTSYGVPDFHREMKGCFSAFFFSSLIYH